MIAVNGKLVAQASQFSLKEVEVITATVDLEEIRAARYAPSRGQQVMQGPEYRRIDTSFRLSPKGRASNFDISPTLSIQTRIHLPEEEIALGPACFLWGGPYQCSRSNRLLNIPQTTYVDRARPGTLCR